nr:MAG TPA: hypothetical protein [Caudoviricetes sp.]
MCFPISNQPWPLWASRWKRAFSKTKPRSGILWSFRLSIPLRFMRTTPPALMCRRCGSHYTPRATT